MATPVSPAVLDFCVLIPLGRRDFLPAKLTEDTRPCFTGSPFNMAASPRAVPGWTENARVLRVEVCICRYLHTAPLAEAN